MEFSTPNKHHWGPPLPRMNCHTRSLATLVFSAFAASIVMWSTARGITSRAGMITQVTTIELTQSISVFEGVKSITPLIREPGVPLLGGKKHLPLLLGVGPAQTSSTPLFDLLRQHPGILVGDATLQGHACCDSELYYFSRHWDGDHPAQALSAFFPPINMKSNARWVAEKTPEYSDHLLAPYRVRSTLLPRSLALVFTLRDPVEAHVSLYFHRMKRKSLPTSASGFVQWSDSLLEAHEEYAKCEQEVLEAAGWETKVDGVAQTPAWVGILSVDQTLFARCRSPYYRPNDALEGVGSLKFSRTLPRWRRVLAGVPMTCIFHSDFMSEPETAAVKITSFLGLPAENIKTKKVADDKAPEERVLAAAGGGDPKTIGAVRRHLGRLRRVFRGELEFAEKFCNDLNRW